MNLGFPLKETTSWMVRGHSLIPCISRTDRKLCLEVAQCAELAHLKRQVLEFRAASLDSKEMLTKRYLWPNGSHFQWIGPQKTLLCTTNIIF